MDSDRDMFSSQPEQPGHIERGTSGGTSSSCPAKLSVNYGFLILFNWEEGSLTIFFYDDFFKATWKEGFF